MVLQVDDITNLIYKFVDNGSLFSDIVSSLDKIDINDPKNSGTLTALEHASNLSKKLNAIPNVNISRDIGVIIVGLDKQKKVVLTPLGAHNWMNAKFRPSKNGIGWITNSDKKVTVGTILDHSKMDYLPLDKTIAEALTSGQVAYLLLIQEFNLSQRVKTALTDLYDLTKSELKLCENLFLGHTLQSASVVSNVKRETIKSHLSKIFAKTGINRQSDLVRMLTQLSAVISVNDYGKSQDLDLSSNWKANCLSVDTQLCLTRYRKPISYSMYGDPDGKPVLYFHSSLGSRSHSKAMALAAKKLGLFIIKFDRPGFGHSPTISGYSPRVLANCIEDLLDNLKISKVDCISQGMSARSVLEITPLLTRRIDQIFMYSPRFESNSNGTSPFSKMVGLTSINFKVFASVLRILYSTMNEKVIKANFKRTFEHSEPDKKAIKNPTVMTFILEHMRLSGRQNVHGTEREYNILRTPIELKTAQYREQKIVAMYGSEDPVNNPRDLLPFFENLNHAKIFICKNEGMLLPYYDQEKLLRCAYKPDTVNDFVEYLPV